ncbi:MAG: SMP-30/gluconolactonase/LRE family protein [Candidatus Acidiferrales bacterium]
MKFWSGVCLSAALTVFSTAAAMAQIPVPPFPQPAGPGMHAPQDVRESALLSMCKAPPPPRRPFNAAGRRGPAPVPPFPYHVEGIPGVVAPGAQWKIVWATNGNNADGLVSLSDGSILMAQNDDSAVVRLYPNGHSETVYTDTDSGGGLTINHRGQIFIAERALMSSIWELAPERKLLADSYNGDSLDCLGGAGIDGPAALDNGGVYFSMGGLLYADPQGHVTRYGTPDVEPNDIVLSHDQKTLYVGSGGKVLAFDVGADGALSNQRVFAAIPGGGNDGGSVDADGRVYFTGTRPGVDVFSPTGQFLGIIPTPFQVISTAFGGPDGRTLYAVGLNAGRGGLIDEVLAIPTIARGYLGGK